MNTSEMIAFVEALAKLNTPVAPPAIKPFADDTGPWRIGENYLIRTVTMTLVGNLMEVYPNELVLHDASWVADTGRFSQALETGNLAEVEPFPKGGTIVGRGAVIDAALWKHPLPEVAE